MYLSIGYIESSSLFVSAGRGQVQVLEGERYTDFPNNSTSPQNLPKEKRSTFTVKRHLYCEKKPLFRKINVYILECVLNEASLKVACCPVFMLWGWGDMAFPAIKYKNSAASGQPACIPGNRSSSNWYTTHWIALSLFNSIYTLASMYFLVFNRSP